MPKRTRDQDHESHGSKKTKPNGPAHAPEEIHFARQLQDLLTFSQDGIPQLKHGIASFKAFLELILYDKNNDNRARQLSILREYLETQRPHDLKDTDHPFLSQLWQPWSYASQNNEDRLLSSISSVLALLLKTLSSLIDFRDHGMLLSRTVLHHQHLRLIKRCLDAPKNKDFLISPCLRLLIEVTSFDGGVLAREVYKRREQTFDFATIRRVLGFTKTDFKDEDDARRRPAVRTLTIRYVLAHLKYLHEGGKIDILKSRPLCTSLFHFLRDDPADVINELLSAVEQCILKDNDLPRSAKSALLVQQNLEHVTDIATRSAEEHGASEKAYAWLKAVCTNSAYGVLRRSGWYPAGTTTTSQAADKEDTIDLGLDSIDFYDKNDKPTIRNTTLLGWIQTLRPHSNLKERELVLACFISAPELVAAYFTEKHMQLEPKLSNTWIGYASFLFEVVKLPVPNYLGNEKEYAQLPPQTSIMMESILPRPMTQKVLTRCLNQSSELITFFAVRILILSFEKMSQVRSLLSQGEKTAGAHEKLWQEASDRLLARFTEMCPAMKDVIGVFRKTPDDDDHALQRQAVIRLLRRYYELVPLQAMEEQFDISTPLTDALLREAKDAEAKEIAALKQLEFEDLLHIAQRSPGMRWLTKQGSLQYSTITTLLGKHCKDLDNRNVRQLICNVLLDNNIVSSNHGCDALLAALQDHNELSQVGPFLDDCFTRAARQPVKYLDALDEILGDEHDEKGEKDYAGPSPLTLVLVEQAPFVAGKTGKAKMEPMSFIRSYFDLLACTDESSAALDAVKGRLFTVDGFNSKGAGIHNPKKAMERVQLPEIAMGKAAETTATPNERVTIPFQPPPKESENHPELLKWSQKDLDMALEEGDINALMLCLCSQYSDIRKQGLSQLYKLEDQLLKSTIEDRDPVYILIGELIETFQQNCLHEDKALPYIAGCFASHAISVQTNPGHFLYPKVNEFLNRGPVWLLNKLPRYWIENTVLSQPTEDDAYWKEVQWVLDWLVDGMRTSADVEISRKTGVFEKVMDLCSSPGARGQNDVRSKVIEMLWRVTFIEGGSTTLITRTGMLTWLDLIKEKNVSVESLLKLRILQNCDNGKIEEWSGMQLSELMQL